MSAEHDTYIEAFEAAGRQRDAAMAALTAYYFKRRAETEQEFADALAAAAKVVRSV